MLPELLKFQGNYNKPDFSIDYPKKSENRELNSDDCSHKGGYFHKME